VIEGGAAARLLEGSELTLLESTAQNGIPNWHGESPSAVLAADASSFVRVVDSSITTVAQCGSFEAFAGPHEESDVPHRQLLSPALVLEAGTASLSAEGLAGDLVVLGASAGSAALELPGVLGPLALAAPQFVVGSKLLPASGVHVFHFPIASPTQPIEYVSFCFQADFVELGGAALLSNPVLVKVPL